MCLIYSLHQCRTINVVGKWQCLHLKCHIVDLLLANPADTTHDNDYSLKITFRKYAARHPVRMHSTHPLLLFTQVIDRILLTILVTIHRAAILNVLDIEEEIVKALVIPQRIARAAVHAALTVLRIRISHRLTVLEELGVGRGSHWCPVVLLNAVRVADNEIAVVHGTWVLFHRRVRMGCHTGVDIHTYSLNNLMENRCAFTNDWHVASSGSTTSHHVQSWMVSGAAVVGGSTVHAAERRGRKVRPKARERMVLMVDNLVFGGSG